jgi:hypothetical protein
MANNENSILPPFSGNNQQFDASVLAQQQFEFEEQVAETTANINLTLTGITNGTIPVPSSSVGELLVTPKIPTGLYPTPIVTPGGTGQVFVADATRRNYIFFHLYVLPTGATIDRLSIVTDQVGTAINARLGLYSDVDGIPDTLLVDAGTVSVTGALGTQLHITLPTPQVLSPGRVWAAFAFQGASNSTQAIRGFSSNSAYGFSPHIYTSTVLQATGGSINNPNVGFITTANTYTGAFPANTTAGSILTTSRQIPLVALRAA